MSDPLSLLAGEAVTSLSEKRQQYQRCLMYVQTAGTIDAQVSRMTASTVSVITDRVAKEWGSSSNETSVTHHVLQAWQQSSGSQALYITCYSQDYTGFAAWGTLAFD